MFPGSFNPSSPEIGRVQALGPVQLQAAPTAPARSVEGAAGEGRQLRDLFRPARVGRLEDLLSYPLEMTYGDIEHGHLEWIVQLIFFFVRLCELM